MKIKRVLMAMAFLCAAFLTHAAVTGVSPLTTLNNAASAFAALVDPAPTTGPGLGNLSYTEAELFKPVSWIRNETSAGAGDGDIPFRYPNRKDYGTNVALMLNGYFLTMFAPDSGQSTGGFLLYDVSDPRNIRLVKKLYEPDGRTAEFREPHAMGAAVINGRQYVVIPSTKGVEFWDFTDINDIQQVKKLVLPTVNAGDYSKVSWQLWWQAPYLYVASADDGMYIVDARDPANAFIANRGEGRPNPVPTGELGSFRVGPIFTMGNHLVLTSMETNSGLASLDLSDPLNPRMLDGVGSLPFYYATCFDGKKLYGSVRNTGAKMFAYDLSDATHFVAEDNRLVMDDQLYCATQDQFVFQGAQEMIHKVNVSNPLNHVHVGKGGLFPEGSEAAHHSDHGQVMPMGNLIYVGNDHGTGSGFIVHDRNPDTTPPAVKEVSPRNAAVKQAVTSRIGVAFTDNILSGTVNASTFIVRPVGGSALAGTYSAQLGIVNFAPAQPLQPDTSYEVVVPSGGMRDYAGNAVATAFTSTFKTAARDALGSTLHSWPLASNVNDVVGTNHGTASAADAFADGAMNFAQRTGGVTLARDDIATVLGGSATVSFHMKTTQAGNANAWLAPGIFGRDQNGGTDDVFWGWIDNTGTLRFTTGNPSASNVGARSAKAVNDGAWHHVVMTRDATTGVQAMYIDGVKTSGPGAVGVKGLNNKFQLLGQIQGSADFFKGSLSNVRVYGRALTDDEVASLSHVVHSWPLVSTVNDVVGGNNGASSPSDLFSDGGLNFGARTAGVTLERVDTAVVLAASASMSFHMKTTQAGNANAWQAPGIFGRDQPSGVDDIFWGWLDNNGLLRLSVGDPSATNVGVRSTKAVNDGQWHYVVLTRDSVTGAQVMYVDGVKSSGAGSAGIKGLTNKSQMLGQIQGNPDFFKGTLANVRVYDRTLSDSEAATLYSQAVVRIVGQPGDETVNVNASATFNPTAVARPGAQYSWNFGDGTPRTAFSGTLSASHTFTTTGHFTVILTVRNADGSESYYAFARTAINPRTAKAPTHSSNIAGNTTRVYSVNPDSGTVTAIDADTLVKLWETRVGNEPRTLAIAPDNRVWVTVQAEDKLVVLNTDGTVSATVTLPYGSGPHGVVFSPDKLNGVLTLESKSQLVTFDPASGATRGTITLPGDVRGIAVSADSTEAYVTRFRSLMTGGEVHRVNLATMTRTETIGLRVDTTTVDEENRARGVPNYLHQVVISPDGTRAVLPSKKDNIVRGQFRDGRPLEHDKTVRSIVSQLDLKAHATELFAEQLDFNDRAPARAATYSPNGDYLFVAQMEGNRVAIVDAYNRSIRGEIDAGRAPHGLYLDEQRKRLYTNNFLGRSVSVHDVASVLSSESFAARLLKTIATVTTEPLAPAVLRGKQVFYNAADVRMSKDSYISCASCHVDGGDDGMVWDFTDRREGLRNTVSLRGRAGLGHGRVHWTANFDEIQDFENDIRSGFGGTGFLSDADFAATSNPLGATKAGRSAALDDLAAFVTSLQSYPRSPARAADGALSSAAAAGKVLFDQQQCATCHTGTTFRDGVRHDVGTIQPSSGLGIGVSLVGVGFDTPTLRGIWDTGPYFHNGQAATLADVFNGGHGNTGSLTAAQKDALVQYLRSIDATTP
ncbi:LamG-like jellyroll fold domain-containing protein [Rhizobacter sp. Root1221]|uniref:LamG-like jellyroll fold domain-containing protein n=1 Tax=Rhizobacter sp. Root1221 TaxID=1736433 RepID=UPI0006FB5B6D|nr:LamG-like jellyroll fold domain-containing protein [Rhizobacter sp. Root1221]KQV92837.1 hypothetical protein ASC87_27630 [Rhizobacter sp. Root1221]